MYYLIKQQIIDKLKKKKKKFAIYCAFMIKY